MGSGNGLGFLTDIIVAESLSLKLSASVVPIYLKNVSDSNTSMEDQEYEKHDEITEKTLKPITKVNSKLDKEMQEWEVESTKDGQDSQGS
jgi:hypothetical protein